METRDEAGCVAIKLEGRLGPERANELLSKIRDVKTDLELDLSRVDSIEVSILQVILVTVASLRKRGNAVIVKDSESGILRSVLRLIGISPEQAGLSASLTL
jgi:anti-anti-sigma regulatory factor